MGWRKNWFQVFGRNPWLWPVPFNGATGKPIGDGVLWPQTYTIDENREGFEPDELNDNTKIIHLNESKEEKNLKLADSDTSLLSNQNKKVLEISLKE